MRTPISIILALYCIQLCVFAQLGENLNDLKSRYGEPVQALIDKDGTVNGYTFNSGNYIFIFRFLSFMNTSYLVEIRHGQEANKTDFTVDEVSQILRTFQPKTPEGDWEESHDSVKPGERLFFLKPTKSIFAKWNVKENYLTIGLTTVDRRTIFENLFKDTNLKNL